MKVFAVENSHYPGYFGVDYVKASSLGHAVALWRSWPSSTRKVQSYNDGWTFRGLGPHGEPGEAASMGFSA